MAREWPLVVFTVISQLAVGSFLLVGIPLYLTEKTLAGGEAGSDIRLAVLLGVLGLLLAGIVSSLFHLHHPFRAFRAVVNLRTSWLSREIIFELILLSLLAVLALFEWGGGGSFLMGLALSAGIAGILFLLSMTKIYVLKAVPAWNGVFTILSFFLAAFVMGSLTSTFVFSLSSGLNITWKTMAVVSLVLLFAGLLNAVLLSPHYGILGARESPSLKPPGSYRPALHILRLALFLPGIVLLGMVLLGIGRWAGNTEAASAVFLACFFTSLAGEVVGRFLFYGLNART